MTERLYTKALIKAVDEETRTVEGIASTEAIDRAGDVVSVDGWELGNFKKNPVLLFAHDYSNLPVGTVEDIQEKTIDGKKVLWFKARIASAKANPFAEQVWNAFKEGLVNAFSVGFMPKEVSGVTEEGGNKIVRHELWEISVVPVPSNPEALALAIGKGIQEAIKTAVPHKEYPLAPEDMEWDAAAAQKRVRDWASDSDGNVDWAKYRKAFAWYDETDEEKVASYKLPHHDIVDGELKTVWRGVAAAMGALLGARGGADIPDADREKVYKHLAAHYKEFEKEPPEFRSIELSNKAVNFLDESIIKMEDTLNALRKFKDAVRVSENEPSEQKRSGASVHDEIKETSLELRHALKVAQQIIARANKISKSQISKIK